MHLIGGLQQLEPILAVAGLAAVYMLPNRTTWDDVQHRFMRSQRVLIGHL